MTTKLWSILSTSPTNSNGELLDQSAAIIPFELYELVPGFILSTVAIFIFSKVGSLPTKEMNEEFESVQKSVI
jgi:sodium/proline symporter